MTVDSPALARDHRTTGSPWWQIGAEIHKVRTTRLGWWLLAGVVLATAWALLRNGVGHHYTLYPPLDRLSAHDRVQALVDRAHARTYAGRAAIAADMVTSGQLIGGMLAMLLGIVIVTTELANGTAATTYLTNPRRVAVIAAKFATAAFFGALCWLVSTVIDVVVTGVYERSQHFNVALTDGIPLRSALLNLLAYVVWAVFGVGLGTLFRGQTAAVGTGLLLYVGGSAVAAIAATLLNQLFHQTWLLATPVAAPAVAALVMITPGRVYDHAPPQWVGLLVMAAYVAVFAAIGTARTRRADIGT
jgi:ABC-type transport system involved in multi-copper enzyme maturation permease subunit